MKMPVQDEASKTALLDVCWLTEERLNAELEKGYVDIAAGRVKDAKEVFDDIRRDYGL